MKQFNVNTFPSLLVMAGTKDMGDGTHQIQMQAYQGKKFQFKPILKFLSKFARKLETQELKTQAAFEKACNVQPCLLLIGTDAERDEDMLKKLARKTASNLIPTFRIESDVDKVATALDVKAPTAVLVGGVGSAGGDSVETYMLKKLAVDATFDTPTLSKFSLEMMQHT
eukprot:SAG31_NODE_15908_length_732_cov_1.345972_2_plen_168_part_01